MNEEEIKEILDEKQQQPQQQVHQQKRTFWNNKRTVRGKALSAWLIVIIAIFMLFTFGIGIYLGKELFADKEKKNDSNPVVDNNDVEEKVNTMDSFIEAALYSDSAGDSIANEFVQGIKDLTENYKLVVTYNSLVKIKNENKKVTEIPEKYKDEEDYWKEAVSELPIESFKNEYKLLFKTELNTKLNDNSTLGCPAVYKYDEDLGNIYLSNQCGGTGAAVYKYKTYKTDEDENYYYVYQYVGTIRDIDLDNKEFKKPIANEVVNVTSFEGNEDKFETLKWTFDKNYNFVKTENLG